MKAKEYFEKYKAELNTTDKKKYADTVGRIVTDMIMEIYELFKERKCATTKALLSLIKEQNDKFNAVINIIETNMTPPVEINRNKFKDFVINESVKIFNIDLNKTDVPII